MDKNLIDLIAKILEAVTIIVFGGLGLTVFFALFGPSLLGINKLQKHLSSLEQKTDETNRLLSSIEQELKKSK